MPLSFRDRSNFILFLKEAFNNVPGVLKGYVKPSMIVSFIEAIPRNYRKYTLQEIVDILEDAREKGEL
jgi:hypothetical protein